MTIEGGAALLLGWASKSLLLEAFGIDSVVELFSAGVLLWRLRVEAGGKASEERIEAVERKAARWVGRCMDWPSMSFSIQRTAFSSLIA